MVADMQDNQTLLDFAQRTAREAGGIMRRYFDANDKEVQLKSDATTVTIADKLINQLVIDRVTAAFPEHGVLAEEGSNRQDRKKLWVCDPIDSTNEFILGMPVAMFSLAYVVDGEPLIAVMYEPQLDKIFTAVKGEGAREDNRPIQVSDCQFLNDARVAFSPRLQNIFAHETFYKSLLAAGVKPMLLPGEAFRGGLTASGKIDAHYFPGRSAHDVAALKLIVEEAGGKVTDLYGQTQRYDKKIYGAIVSNGHLHDALVQLMHGYGPERYIGY